MKSRGLIKLFLIIFIGVALLAYFNIDVQAFFEKPAVANVISTVWGFLTAVWDFVNPYLHMAWDFMIEYIWTPVTDRLNLGNKAATSTSVSL